MATFNDANGRTVADDDTPAERDREDVRPPLGSRLGRYVLLHPIGEGGMGIVYAARDPELGRKVALKLVRSSGRRAQTRRARLLREAQALARLSHPNVVGVLDAGVVDARDWDPEADPPERVWIAMELVEADTLAAWLHRERPAFAAIVDVFVAAGRGLHAAHEAGLVHRDFKPENVLVAREGDRVTRVAVTDFGLARPMASTQIDHEAVASHSSSVLQMRLTRTGASIGTPAYMSPEQHRREPVDARSDQFNFCVSLYEALYRQAPHAGVDIKQRAREVEAGRIRPPGRSDVPSRFFRVLQRGLAPRPHDRFATMQALLRALQIASAPRRRAVWAIGATVVVGGALAWIVWPAPRSTGCAGEVDPLGAVWNDARVAELDAAVASSPLSYASETWSRARPRLAEYAIAWSTAYRETCDAASDDLARRDVTMACLTDRRLRFEALVDALQRAEAASIRDAVASVAALPPVLECAREGSELAPPPALRDAVASVRARLARLDAQDGTVAYEQLLVRADEIVAAAEQVGWPPLHADALYRRGVLQQAAAHHGDAQSSLERAYFVADDAGDARTAARAAIHLCYILGAIRSDLPAGLAWGRHAAAAIDLLGDSLALRAALANALGEVHVRHGRYAQAYAEHVRATELGEALHGPESVDVAMGLNNVGNVLFLQGDPAAAADHYARSLAIRERELGPRHPAVGASLSNLGSMQRLLGRSDEALPHLQRALAIMQSALGPEHPDVGNPLNSLFLVHQDRGEWDEARAYIERALAVWERTYGDEHPHVAIARANIGLLLLRRGQATAALVELERAVDILERVVGVDHPNLAFVLATLGRAYLDLDRPARAREVLLRALPLRRGRGEGAGGVAIVEARLAEADLREGGDPDDAIAAGQRALAALRQAGPAWNGDAEEVAAWVAHAQARNVAR